MKKLLSVLILIAIQVPVVAQDNKCVNIAESEHDTVICTKDIQAIQNYCNGKDKAFRVSYYNSISGLVYVELTSTTEDRCQKAYNKLKDTLTGEVEAPTTPFKYDGNVLKFNYETSNELLNNVTW